MIDLRITDGRVFLPGGGEVVDVLINDGRIVGIGTDTSIEATETISAAGCLVLPGGVEPHVHCDDVWTLASGEVISSANCTQVSKAALYGGVTTLVDFAWSRPGDDLAAVVDSRVQSWDGASYCDYSFHVALQGEIEDDRLEAIPGLISAGFPSYKIFTTDVLPSHVGIHRTPLGSIMELFGVLSNHGGVAAVHAEDDEIVMHMYRKYIAAGRTGSEYMSEVHNTISEDVAFSMVLTLADHFPGLSLYMMHVSSGKGVEAISRAQRRGVVVIGETLPQYVLLTDSAYQKSDGVKHHTYPSIKSADDGAALWAGLKDGSIGVLGTDEVCTSFDAKTSGHRIDDVVGGNSGLEPKMSLLFTEMVAKRGFGIEDFVRATSSNAARVLGMYPRKGAIAVGSDADLVIFDPSRPSTIRAGELHETDYTPWEGWQIAGAPVTTILRGSVVVRDGEWIDSAPAGQLVVRERTSTGRSSAIPKSVKPSKGRKQSDESEKS